MIVEVFVSRAGQVVAAAFGELDMASGPRLHADAVAAIDAHRPREFVIDLAGVSFLDAAGVSALLAAHRHARGRGAGFTLINARPIVTRVLSILELTEVLHVKW